MKRIIVLILLSVLVSGVSAQQFAENTSAKKSKVAAKKDRVEDLSSAEFLVADHELSTNHYYLIVAVYQTHAEAKAHVHDLRPRGFEAEIIHRKKEQVFLVHIPCYQTEEIDWSHMTDVRNEFSKAWFQKMY